MRTLLRALRLAALAAAAITATASSSYAATCETPLDAQYQCSGTYSDGSSGTYCIHAYVVAPGDGEFILDEDGVGRFYCTCEARGKAPNVRFGASTGSFFCSGDSVALIGKASGTRIVGQGYAAAFAPGTRSSFTCRAVDTCN